MIEVIAPRVWRGRPRDLYANLRARWWIPRYSAAFYGAPNKGYGHMLQNFDLLVIGGPTMLSQASRRAVTSVSYEPDGRGRELTTLEYL